MVIDKMFSLGLSYFEIMDLPSADLQNFLQHCSLEEIIDWLQWNDPNGVYRDEQSLEELGNICSKKKGIQIIIRQLGDA